MKKRFNFIDTLIIIFLVVASILAIVYFSTQMGYTKKVSKNQLVQYTVELKSVQKDVGELLKKGDEVKNSISGEVIGKIVNIDIRDNVETREDTISGKFVETSFSDRDDVYVTVESVPVIDEKNCITVDSLPIKIGKTMHIRTKDYASSGFIVDLKLIDKEK